jgi:hypothetical protein
VSEKIVYSSAPERLHHRIPARRDPIMSKPSVAFRLLRTGGPKALALATARKLDHVHRNATLTLSRAKRRALEFGVRPHFLRGRVKYLYGPPDIRYGVDDLLVISVVRNVELYIKSFMEHHLALGVGHFVFLDNGSTDSTVERLRTYPQVTVLWTDAPYERYENTMKRYLAERFSRGRWCLCVDGDELFDYPFSRSLSLGDFLRYLNHNRYTAVVAQMLDMFSGGPFTTIESTPDDRLKEKYPFYDLSSIVKSEYEWSEPSTPHIKMHWGGIRRAVFGTGNGLTKAALVRMDGRVRPFVEWHQATGALVADVSCVLMHYPFVSTFPAKVREAVRTGRYGMTTTDEYVAYLKGLEMNPMLALRLDTARRFEDLEQLIAEDFLVVSDKYRQWVKAHGG